MSLVVNGSSQYGYCNLSGYGGAYPLSFSIWFKSTSDSAVQTMLSLDDNSSTQNYLQARGDQANDILYGGSYQSAHAVASTTTGYTVNTWHHALVVYAAANDRRVYIDGGSKGTVATTQNAAGVYLLSIGCRYGYVGGAAPSLFFAGKLAEAAIWTSALSDANAVSLASGDYTPEDIDAGNLLSYWPLYDDAVDDAADNDFTLVGSPSYDSDHPYGVMLDLAATVTSASTISATLAPSIQTYKPKLLTRLIAIGNDRVFYEDV